MSDPQSQPFPPARESPRDVRNDQWSRGSNDDTLQDRIKDNGPQGNGETPGGAAGLRSDDMEEWEEWEEEQDDAAMDYYALLNVPQNATSSQIRSSYHNLSLRFHPDKQPPHRRERTTLHFNNILVAYETLNNPHKRAIYDTLGIEGLKQKYFDLGIKAMGPEEFKIWLQEQVRKQKVAEVMSIVNSKGYINIKLDVSGLQFKEAIEVVGPDGVKKFQVRDLPLVRPTEYAVRHSFRVPLESLGEILITPFPKFKESMERGEPHKEKQPRKQNPPGLTLTAFLAGASVQTKKGHQAFVASPALSAQITHSFPPSLPNDPPSIASVLAGLDFEVTSTIFPQRVFSTEVSKSFGTSRLILKPVFHSSPLLAPPIVEATYASSVGKRGNFFIQYNSGTTPKWPSAVTQLLSGPAQTSQLTIGYTIMPTVGTPTVDDDDDNGAENYQYPHTEKRDRSKATETWRVTATAGFMVGGMQLGLSWGRTYFIGTPIGPSSSLDPTVKLLYKPRNEGIKMNVDVMVGLLGGVMLNGRASRKIFTHTRIGVGIGIGGTPGKDGVVLSINWSRLGQKIAVPIAIAPIPELKSILYGTLIPFIGYALIEGLYLRPRQHKLRRKEVEKIKRQLMVKVAKSKKKADEMVELMKESVKLSQQKREEEGGLVIIKAVYGLKGKEGECADVTIALAGLIEDDQLVIPRGLNKSHITGFYDPAPGEKKELYVEYLFKGKMHEITVGNYGLAIPMKAHCIE